MGYLWRAEIWRAFLLFVTLATIHMSWICGSLSNMVWLEHINSICFLSTKQLWQQQSYTSTVRADWFCTCRHAIAYEVVASLLSMFFVWSVTMSFYTIATKYNGPLYTFYCNRSCVRHEMVFWWATSDEPKFDGLFFFSWHWRLFTWVEYADLFLIWSD